MIPTWSHLSDLPFMRYRGRPRSKDPNRHHLWGPGHLLSNGKFLGRQVAEDEWTITVQWFEGADTQAVLPKQYIFDAPVPWEDEIRASA